MAEIYFKKTNFKIELKLITFNLLQNFELHEILKKKWKSKGVLCLSIKLLLILC